MNQDSPPLNGTLDTTVDAAVVAEHFRPPLLALDTLDDRREIWALLHRLAPADRVRWLGRVCATIRNRDRHGPRPSLWRMRETIRGAYRCDRWDVRLTNEIYGDLLVMSSQYRLDLAVMAKDLERTVRRREPVTAPAEEVAGDDRGLWLG